MSRTLLLVCLLLGGGGLFWFSQHNKHTDAPAPVAVAQTAKILVAAAPTQAGTLLKDIDFKEKEVPIASVRDDQFTAGEVSLTEIRGAMLRRYLENGEALTKADILRPRDRGFLAAVLAPGTRAVAIGVDATTGAAGLISPGDLVDVILSQEFARGETSIGRRVVAETVLTSVRVIAVDQQIAQGAPTTTTSTNAPKGIRVASTVSLQVTPDQAAKVVVAERLGRLTLSIRSIDPEQHPRNSAAATVVALGDHEAASASVFGSDVSSALSSKQEPATAPKLRLIQGDSATDVVFR